MKHQNHKLFHIKIKTHRRCRQGMRMSRAPLTCRRRKRRKSCQLGSQVSRQMAKLAIRGGWVHGIACRKWVGEGGPVMIRSVGITPTTLKLTCCMEGVLEGCRGCSRYVSRRRQSRGRGGNSRTRGNSRRARTRTRARTKTKTKGRRDRHAHPKYETVNTSKDSRKSVQAVAVEKNGATSKKKFGRGGNLVVKKDHPTSPISLHAAPRERSSLL
jgi:hypothetical protein